MDKKINITIIKIITIVVISSSAIFAVVFPLVIFHGRTNNSSSTQTSFNDSEFLTPETVASEIVEVIPVDAESISKNKQRTAPVPKNFVNAIDKEDVKSNINYETPAATPDKLINVPYINQNKLYPSGCESVSAVMDLNYLGYDITVNSFIDNYLDKSVAPYLGSDGNSYGFDPREYFLGDPYSDKGWGCLSPVIVKALNRYIDHNRHSVENITGTSLFDLRSYLDRDIPVIVWATQGMKEPRKSKTWTIVDTDKKYTWTAPNHCLLLVGYDDTGYYFNDPLTHANCHYPADIVENRYNAMGKQAIVITNNTVIVDTAAETIKDNQLPGEQEENSQNQTKADNEQGISHKTENDLDDTFQTENNETAEAENIADINNEQP